MTVLITTVAVRCSNKFRVAKQKKSQILKMMRSVSVLLFKHMLNRQMFPVQSRCFCLHSNPQTESKYGVTPRHTQK